MSFTSNPHNSFVLTQELCALMVKYILAQCLILVSGGVKGLGLCEDDGDD